MRLTRWIPYALALSLLVFAVPRASADEAAWRTPLKLSEPTEIPYKVLPPGDYVVKVLNTQETRSIVQFLNANETEVIATVVAVPNYRVRPAEATEFTYFQRASGHPQALKSWLYPGNSYGVQFVYPKAEAIVIAEETRETVVATPSPEPTIQSEVIEVTPERKEVPFHAPAPILPKTGSDLPLVGILAAASLAGAAGLRILGGRIG
jgi:hypothetical protein